MFSLNYYTNSTWFPYVFAVLLAAPFFVLLRQFVHNYIRMKNQELKMLTVKGNAANKSQAYERMTLFLERIKPSNLVIRFDKDLAPHEFVYFIEKSIREEYDYNASQQLYISKVSWQNIIAAKNAVIALAHNSYKGLSSAATLDDFKTVFLMNYVNGEDFISQTIDDMRRETLILGN